MGSATRRTPDTRTDEHGALRLVEAVFGVSHPVLLGMGQEGVVVGTERKSYKVFRQGPSHLSSLHRETLIRALGPGQDPPKRVLPVEEIREADEHLIIVSPRVTGTAYQGGRWWELVELLQECRSREIAITNIHPGNFVVTAQGIVYVDLGASIVPLTQSQWDQMVKRTYLSFRCPTRPDLKALMTRSLTEDLLELEGKELLQHDAEAPETTPIPQPTDRNRQPTRDVTLLIRTCMMEWATIEFQVEHLVTQLEGPHRFREVLLVTDTNQGPFARQYDHPDPDAQDRAIRRLLRRGLVDRLVMAPLDAATVSETNRRWFGISTSAYASQSSEPTYTSLYGIDQCRTDRVLEVDSDVLIGRKSTHDYLSSMVDVLETNPDAVSVSLPLPLEARQPFSARGPSGKWRVEVRCALLDRARLEALLPLPNSVVGGRLALSWYRALDDRIANAEASNYRGGDPDCFMVHVPNATKPDHNRWYNVTKAVERGCVSRRQVGKMDLAGDLGDWLGRREEDLVFVVRGRDVPLSRLDRCIESLRSQSNQTFGIVFIDAGSTNGMAETLESLCRGPLRHRASYYRNWDVVTDLENQTRAIRELVAKPDSIVALLDADDALLGRHVVDKVLEAYREGADLTVGSMLRTDRSAEYPVCFDNPRGRRGGGNVWQHLRTFRRRLFDVLRDEDLKVNGKWIPYASDWAYMLPMVELATHPVWIQDALYLYDPSPKLGTYSTEDRERLISLICGKPSYNGARTSPRQVTPEFPSTR